VSEDYEKNYALSVYLIGYSLADETAKKLPSNDDAKICFNLLAVACQNLFVDYNKSLFIEACGAAAQLGLSVKFLDAKAKRELSKHKQFATENGIREVSKSAALKRIQEAITVAYKSTRS
jgi:hypothetical protein